MGYANRRRRRGRWVHQLLYVYGWVCVAARARSIRQKRQPSRRFDWTRREGEEDPITFSFVRVEDDDDDDGDGDDAHRRMWMAYIYIYMIASIVVVAVVRAYALKMMLLIGMNTSLTKNPTKPMITNPVAVRAAIFQNSSALGLVHFLTRRMLSLAKSRTGLMAISATSMVELLRRTVTRLRAHSALAVARVGVGLATDEARGHASVMSHCHASSSSSPCAPCAGTGVRAAADGFEACPACRGAGAVDARDACCASHGGGELASSSSARASGSFDVMRAVRALRLVDERDAPRAFGEAEDVALLYFTSKDCGACKRFAPTLMAFAKAHDVRVVAIACDASSTAYAGLDGSNFTRVRVREVASASDEDGTSVVALNALLRALSIRFLPTVVVVNLKLDVVVTDWGRTVMSLNSNPLPAWRRGESGLIPNPMRPFMKGIEQCAYGGGGDSSAA